LPAKIPWREYDFLRGMREQHIEAQET